MITARDNLMHVVDMGLTEQEAETYLAAPELAEVCRALVKMYKDRWRLYDKELQDLPAQARQALGLEEESEE
jgi:hypothetical protein